jgi:hypothetical protein
MFLLATPYRRSVLTALSHQRTCPLDSNNHHHQDAEPEKQQHDHHLAHSPQHPLHVQLPPYSPELSSSSNSSISYPQQPISGRGSDARAHLPSHAPSPCHPLQRASPKSAVALPCHRRSALALATAAARGCEAWYACILMMQSLRTARASRATAKRDGYALQCIDNISATHTGPRESLRSLHVPAFENGTRRKQL